MATLEWTKAGEGTFYLPGPMTIGLVSLPGGGACLIDTGNNKKAMSKISRSIEEMGLTPSMVINTHAHADHISGNAWMAEHKGCDILVPPLEHCMARHPFLKPALIYGGNPPPFMRGRYLMAEPSPVTPLLEENLPEGFMMKRIDGHSLAMVAVKSPDDVWFIGDLLLGETALLKHPIPFLVDIAAHLASMEAMEQETGRLFIPSHGEPTKDLKPLIGKNRQRIMEIREFLLEQMPGTVDLLTEALLDQYGDRVDPAGYFLTQTTVKGFLTWMLEEGLLEGKMEGSRLLFARCA